MRRTLVLVVILGALISTAWAQQNTQQIADEVIAMTKAQWTADIEKNTAAAMKDLSDDYTEFNGDYSARIEGKTMATRLADAGNKASSAELAAEMGNPKVQVYNGDVAILTYNFMGLSKDKDGKTEPTRAKSTRVFVKQGGQWKLVHANFAPDPLPKQ